MSTSSTPRSLLGLGVTFALHTLTAFSISFQVDQSLFSTPKKTKPLRLALDSPPPNASDSHENFSQIMDQVLGALSTFNRKWKTTLSAQQQVDSPNLSVDHKLLFAATSALVLQYPEMINKLFGLLELISHDWNFQLGQAIFNPALWCRFQPKNPDVLPLIFTEGICLAAKAHLHAESALFEATHDLVMLRLDHSDLPKSLKHFLHEVDLFVDFANNTISPVKQFFGARHTIPYWSKDIRSACTILQPTVSEAQSDDVAFSRFAQSRFVPRGRGRGRLF
jgi:hypothetical protein